MPPLVIVFDPERVKVVAAAVLNRTVLVLEPTAGAVFAVMSVFKFVPKLLTV
jgi:hypothetical protein